MTDTTTPTAEKAALLAKLAPKMLEVLLKVETGISYGDSGDEVGEYTCCYNTTRHGHTPTCWYREVQAVLDEANSVP